MNDQTPRTSAATVVRFSNLSDGRRDILYWVDPEFARQLERELNEAKAYSDDTDGVLDNIVNEFCASIERLNLSKVPDAGSLKSDEAVSYCSIVEREITTQRAEIERLKLGVHKFFLVEHKRGTTEYADASQRLLDLSHPPLPK